jgi:aspartate carbamoyltransferase catalytic subunit
MLARNNPQLNRHEELIHLLSIEGLPQPCCTTSSTPPAPFLSVNEREVKKVPLLRGKSVFNLFFENSTRTRTTFEIAAKRLSADVINLDIARSSTAKGESLLDTIANLSAMHADMFVVRHGESGAPYLIAQHCAPHVHVVNAGDGRHAHPTQGLLDMYTIRHYKRDFRNLTVAVVGDIVHSRVARSDIHALTTLGVPEIRAVGPKTLVPGDLKEMGVRVCHDMAEGIRDADVIIMLRLQNERMSGAMLPSAGEFFKTYGLTLEKLALAKPDAIVMHPGRSTAASRSIRPSPTASKSVILPQVTFGIRGADGGDVDHRRQHAMTTARDRGALRLLIAGGRVVDPASGHDAPGDVAVADGRVVAIGARPADFVARPHARRTRPRRDARPRRPRGAPARAGHEHERMLESEMAAAVAGGVTSVICPPDTEPVLDEPGWSRC